MTSLSAGFSNRENTVKGRLILKRRMKIHKIDDENESLFSEHTTFKYLPGAWLQKFKIVYENFPSSDIRECKSGKQKCPSSTQNEL